MDTEPPSRVYDAAIVMAKYIEKNFDLTDKTAVELGAGCGFTACHLVNKFPNAKSIIATDTETVIPLISKNVEAN